MTISGVVLIEKHGTNWRFDFDTSDGDNIFFSTHDQKGFGDGWISIEGAISIIQSLTKK